MLPPVGDHVDDDVRAVPDRGAQLRGFGAIRLRRDDSQLCEPFGQRPRARDRDDVPAVLGEPARGDAADLAVAADQHGPAAHARLGRWRAANNATTAAARTKPPPISRERWIPRPAYVAAASNTSATFAACPFAIG